MKVDDAIDKLNAAYKRLDEPQGRIARRNARQAFLYALRCLRQSVDDEYPNIPKPRAKPRRRRRKKNLLQKIDREAHRRLLAAGVKPSRFKTIPGDRRDVIWAPTWMARAYAARMKPETIAEAARRPSVRKKLDAAVRLGAKKKR